MCVRESACDNFLCGCVRVSMSVWPAMRHPDRLLKHSIRRSSLDDEGCLLESPPPSSSSCRVERGLSLRPPAGHLRLPSKMGWVGVGVWWWGRRSGGSLVTVRVTPPCPSSLVTAGDPVPRASVSAWFGLLGGLDECDRVFLCRLPPAVPRPRSSCALHYNPTTNHSHR